MSKNKLLAGLLSLAMAASLMPVNVLAAETAETEEYVYFEGFEGTEYDEIYDHNGTVWQSQLMTEADGTNHYMKYSYDPNQIYINKADRKAIPTETIIETTELAKLQEGRVYELGYKVKFNTYTNYSTVLMVGMYGENKIDLVKSAQAYIYLWAPNDNALIAPLKDINEWVTAKARIRVSNGEYQMEYDRNNTTTITQTGTRSGITSTTPVDSITLTFTGGDVIDLATESILATRDGGNGIMIDDIYIKDITDEAPPTVYFNLQGYGETFTMPLDVCQHKLLSLPEVPQGNELYEFVGWYNAPNTLSYENEISDIAQYTFNNGQTVYAGFGRKRYDVHFHKNDGSGETIDNRSDLEANVEIPDISRVGYVFDGWYLDDGIWEQPFDGTDITEETDVYAKWIEIFTAEFNSNGGSAVEAIDTITGEITLPTPPVKTGYEFDGWYLDDGTWEQPFDEKNVTQDITVYAKWLDAYGISFVTNGGDAIEPIYFADKVKYLPIAEYLGYRFDGWFTDKELTKQFVAGGNINSDITIYAKWTRKHKVTLDVNGGNELDPIYILGDDIPELPIAKKPGSFHFDGWYWDEGFTRPFDGTGVTQDITVYAKYSQVYVYFEDFEETYDDFYNNDGTVWKSELMQETGNENHYMKYYYDTSATLAEETIIDAETLATLEPGRVYEVGYRTKVNTTVEFSPVSLNGVYGEKTFVLNNSQPLSGNLWDKGNKIGAVTAVDEWVTIRARIRVNTGEYQTEYEKGNNKTITSTATQAGISSTTPVSSVTLTFKGGNNMRSAQAENNTLAKRDGGNGIMIDDIYIKDITDETPPTVIIDMLGFGENFTMPIDVCQHKISGNIPLPAEVCGYGFVGWFIDPNKLSNTYKSAINANRVFYDGQSIYAGFVKIHNVTLVKDNGEENLTLFTDVDGRISEFPEVTKEGALFAGWYYDEDFTQPFDERKEITTDINLYAKWSSENYTVHFVTNSNEVMNDLEVVPGTKRLPRAKDITVTDADGNEKTQVFIGWYTDEACTQKFNAVTADGTTVYAKYDGDYIVYEDFENAEYHNMWDLGSNIGTQYDQQPMDDIYKNRLLDEGDNGYMEYYKYPTLQEQLSQIFLNRSTNLKLEQNTDYELSFKLDLESEDGLFTPSFSSFGVNVVANDRYTKIPLLSSSSANNKQFTVFGKQLIKDDKWSVTSPDGFITFTVRFNTTTGKAKQYIKYTGIDGNVYTEEIEKQLTIPDGKYIATVERMPYTIANLNNGSTSGKERSFRLDDVYIKKCASDF